MDTSLLKALLEKLPEGETIPQWDKIKDRLYTLCVQQNGPGQRIINHYYLTGKPVDQPMLNDPCDQAHWCQKYLSHCSQIVKRITQVRNILVHNNFLDLSLLRRLIEAIVELVERRPHNIVIELAEQMTLLCQTMIEGQENELINDQLLVYSIETTLKLAQKKNSQSLQLLIEQCQKVLKETIVVPVITTIVDLTVLPKLPESGPIQTLEYWKNNGWKEVLKGKKIRIKGGKWCDHLATLKSWSGTVVNVVIDDHGKCVLRLSEKIEILIDGQ